MKQLEEIFRKRFLLVYPKLYSIALAILGSSTDLASDAVQETMVKIWSKGDELLSVNNPEALSIAILRTTAIDIMRRQRKYEQVDTITDIAPDSPPDHETATILERIIDTMPPAQKEILRLSIFEDLSAKEISEITGVSGTNVRQLLSRGRKKIKEIYSKL